MLNDERGRGKHPRKDREFWGPLHTMAPIPGLGRIALEQLEALLIGLSGRRIKKREHMSTLRRASDSTIVKFSSKSNYLSPHHTSIYLPQKIPRPANAHNLQKGFYEVPVNSKSVICSFPTVTTPLGFRKIPEALNPKLLRWFEGSVFYDITSDYFFAKARGLKMI
jgi:hypothetical protein